MHETGLETHRLRVRADAGSVTAAGDWIRSVAAGHPLSPDDAYRIELCVGEILTNILEHGCPHGMDTAIGLALTIDRHSAIVQLEDDGDPFDPLAHLAGAAPRDRDAPPGGWGLRLVERFADRWDYERIDDRNATTLRFELQRAPGEAATVPAETGAGDRAAASPPGNVTAAPGGPALPPVDPAATLARHQLDQLAALDLFRGAPRAVVDSAIGECTVATFREETVLLRPGDRNDVVAVVLDGRLRVCLGTLEDRDFVSIEPGRLVGELSVVDGEPVSAFVVAEASTRLLLVDQETLFGRLLPVPAISRNFMRMLTGRVRRTSERIVEQMREAHAVEQLQRDLRVAHDIEVGMLPDPAALFPERHDIDFAADIRVAQAVGGDFYDAFFVDQHHLFVATGDVCGKGLPAALFMVRALTLLRSEATNRSGARLPPLCRTIERVNRQLLERNEVSLFVTLFCAVLDTRSGRLVHVNAGHDAPVLRSPDGRSTFLEGRRNPIVGILEHVRFESSETILRPGSTLLLYTDGVTEAESASREPFGPERLLRVVGEEPVEDARALVARTLRAVLAFGAGAVQSDDITLVALRYAGAT